MKRMWIWAGLCAFGCWTGGHHAFADFSSIDLEVESIQIQPSRPYTGDGVTVVAVIRNNGSQAAGAFEVSVSLRQNEKGIRTIQKIPVLSNLPRMGSGKSVPLEIGKLSEGDYEAAVTVDPENGLQETNEKNNVRTRGFHVSAKNYA